MRSARSATSTAIRRPESDIAELDRQFRRDLARRSAPRSTSIATNCWTTTIRDDSLINDSRGEWETVHKIDASLAADRQGRAERRLDRRRRPAWTRSTPSWSGCKTLSWELPSFLHERIHDFAGEVRIQYRALIFLTWITTISAAICCWACSFACSTPGSFGRCAC